MPAATLVAVVVLLAAGGYDFTKARRAYRPVTYLDLPLGVKRVPGVEESGFYHREEYGGQPCRWTDGAAKVVPATGAERRSRSRP